MDRNDDMVDSPQVKPFGKGKDGKKPPGTKGVYAYLPMTVFYRVQAAASLNQMDVQSFVGKLLTDAFQSVPEMAVGSILLSQSMPADSQSAR